MMHRCRFCDDPVRTAQDGVVLRAGRLTLTLCTKHARFARASAVIMGQAAVRGLGKAIEARYPQTGRALETANALGAAIDAELQRDAGEEPEVIDAQPRRVEVVQPRRRAASKHADVIEGEIIEVKP